MDIVEVGVLWKGVCMIKTLLFDVDGVIVTGEPWGKELAQNYGITEEMRRPFFRDAFQPCLIGQADLKEALAPYLVQWNWPHSPEAFLDYWFCRERTIDARLIQVVQQLRQRGITCYIATQQERYRTAYLQHEMGLVDVFDGMFSSVDLGCMKSEAAFFASILRELDGYQAEEMLFWDDTPINVATAQSVGIQAELYNNFAGFVHTMQTYGLEIESL